MAVAGLSFEELEFSSPSLLILFLATFGFLSPVLPDFSLLVLFLPAIALRSCRICTGYDVYLVFLLIKSMMMARFGGGRQDYFVLLRFRRGISGRRDPTPRGRKTFYQLNHFWLSK